MNEYIEGYNKPNIASNMLWKFAERMGVQVMSFVVAIILARLLAPEEYGLIALVTVFVSVLEQFVTSGLGQALIQRRNADNVDFSTLFLFNLCFSVLLYILIFTGAPLLSGYFGFDTALIPVIRVTGTRIILSSINSIQTAYVSRKMMFKQLFRATTIGAISSGAIGILMAYNGLGIWSLVVQNLLNSLIGTVVLWFTLDWRPQKRFSLARLGRLLSFGWKLLAAGLLYTVYNNSRQLLIGKVYSVSDLALYNKGQQLPSLLMSNIIQTISAVLFPTLSSMQDDIMRVKDMTRKVIRISSFVIFPMLTGLAVVAQPLILLLLGEKWLGAVPYLRIACGAYAMQVMQVSVQDSINSIGRSDIFLKMDVVAKVFSFSLLVLVMHRGVQVIALTALVTGALNVGIKLAVSRRILKYKYREHIADIIPIILASAIMGGIVYSASFLSTSNAVTLLVQVPLGTTSYILVAKMMRLEEIELIEYYAGKLCNR